MWSPLTLDLCGRAGGGCAPVYADTIMALASLALAVYESRRVRRGEQRACTLFVLFLACAAGFTAFAVHG